MNLKYHDISPLLAGSLCVLAFAPFRIAWLAIIAVAMLFASLRQATPKQGFIRGWLFGLGLFGFGLSWLHIVIHDHGAMPIVFAWLLTAVFIALLSLLFAVQGYLCARFIDFEQLSGRLLLFPLSWVVFEWLRSTLFTGFPWLLLGVSQSNGPLGNLLPYIGIGGTTFAVALCGVGIAMCVQQIGGHNKARLLAVFTLLAIHYFVPAAPLWALIAFFIYNILFIRNQTTWAFTFLVGIYLTAGITQHIQLTQPEKDISVSMVQVNVPNRIKWDPSEIANTVNKYFTLSEKVWQSDVIIWPEAAIPQLKQDLPQLMDNLKRQAIQHDTTLIMGLPSFDRDNLTYHNSLFVVGKEEGEYHKRHLVPFGEYVPLQDLIRGVFSFLDLPMSMLSPGPTSQPSISMRGETFAPFICFETAYSSMLARSLPEAKVLVAISDDSWFGQSIAGQQHLQIGQALAAVGGRDLLHSTNTGVTAIVNHQGKVTQAIAPHQPGVLTGKVQARTGITPWVWLNQWPLWSWLANGLFALGLWQQRKTIQGASATTVAAATTTS